MTSAVQLARRYDQYLAAVWRGDDASLRPFVTWLAGFWNDAPDPPAATPAALSPLGAGGRGIVWYETPTRILGYAAGVPDRCYQIPRAQALPPAVVPLPPRQVRPVALVPLTPGAAGASAGPVIPPAA